MRTVYCVKNVILQKEVRFTILLTKRIFPLWGVIVYTNLPFRGSRVIQICTPKKVFPYWGAWYAGLKSQVDLDPELGSRSGRYTDYSKMDLPSVSQRKQVFPYWGVCVPGM